MAAVWTAISGRSTKGVMAATDTAPTGAEDGLNLSDVAGFSIHVELEAGQTITAAAGGLKAYLFDPIVGFWSRTPELDVSFASSDVGERRVSRTGYTVSSPRGRLAHIASGMTVSGGGVTVYYSCSILSGERA